MKKIKVAFLTAAAAMSAAAMEVSIVADRENCLYRAGETARLVVTFTERDGSAPTGGVVKAILDNFGEEAVFASRELDLAKTNRFEFAQALGYPGFLRLRLGHPELPKLPQCDPDWYVWGVAFSPEGIMPGAENPDDFDVYWRGEKARLEREVPLDAKMEIEKSLCRTNRDVYRVSFATFGGKRVYGWLTVPKDAGEGPFPVHVQVPGAGCGAWANHPLKRRDAITLFMTVFDWPPDVTDGEPAAMAKFRELNVRINEEEGFHGREDAVGYPRSGCLGGRDAYFYHDVWLGINRAVDWVASRPDADRSRFVYEGTSQGGAGGLALGCLNTNFTRIAVYVPAMTDLLGSRHHRRASGWPKLVEYQCDDARRAAAEKLAPYYDGANFARRFRTPIRFVVGFADHICPPHAVYAAYNVCASRDKAISHGVGMTHDVFHRFYDDGTAWLSERADAPEVSPDFEEALAEARKSGRRVLAAFTSSGSSAECEAFGAKVLAGGALSRAAAAKGFVYSLVDVTTDAVLVSPERLAKNRATVAKIGVVRFPAVVLFEANGNVVTCVGYEDGDAASTVRHIDDNLEAQRLYALHLRPFRDEVVKLESNFMDGYSEALSEGAEAKREYLRTEGQAWVRAVRDAYRRFSEAKVPAVLEGQKKWMDEHVMRRAVKRAEREIEP